MPESPLFGIMWYDARNPQAFDHIRHECDQRDEMGRFGWSSHDGRNFGAQILQDDRSFVNLTTEFLRIQPSQEGEEILVRVQGKSIPEDADEVPIGFMYYWTLEDEDDAIRLRSKAETSGIAGPVDLEIDMGNMGKIQMQVVGDEENLHPEAFAKRGHRRRRHTEKLDKTNFLGIEKHLLYNSDDKLGDSMQMASRQLEFWNIKEIVREAMRSSWIQKYKDAAKLMEKGEPFDQTIYHALPNKRIKDPQAIVFQQILKTPFQMLFKFTYEREISSVSLSDNEQITRLFNEARFSFEQKFKFNFPVSEKHMALSQHAFSNLIGGVGYFEGKWLKAIKTREGVIGFPSGPNELLTAVPCRSFFPRGFLWDEGFHLLPIAKFDPLLA